MKGRKETKSKHLLVAVKNLKEGSNLLEWKIEPEELEIEDISFIGEVAVLMDIVKRDKELIVSGKINFQSLTTCAYCGEEFTREASEEFTGCYIKGDMRRLPPRLDLTEEEIDRVYYSGEVIDLFPLIRDTIILSVPIAPQCGRHHPETSETPQASSTQN